MKMISKMYVILLNVIQYEDDFEEEDDDMTASTKTSA